MLITEENLQGAIRLANEITETKFRLGYSEGIYSLIMDGEVIADGGIEKLYDILVGQIQSSLN